MIAANETGRRHQAALGAAGWLGLAATPTFAAMALMTYVTGGDTIMICSAMHDAPPLSGMVPMYVLMSAFHSAPWLKLLSFGKARLAGHLAWKYSRMSRVHREIATVPNSLHDGEPRCTIHASAPS